MIPRPKYKCPACDKPVDRTDPHRRRVGLWAAHGGCRIVCTLCSEEITEPAVGRARDVSVWLSEPVHTACKAALQAEWAEVDE